jgi:hypothetical protein
MKLHEKRTAEYRISNRKMSKCGIASGFAFGYAPTGRSVFIYKIDRSTQKLTTCRIQYFDIRYSLFDIRYSLFIVSSTIRLDARGQRPRLHEK